MRNRMRPFRIPAGHLVLFRPTWGQPSFIGAGCTRLIQHRTFSTVNVYRVYGNVRLVNSFKVRKK